MWPMWPMPCLGRCCVMADAVSLPMPCLWRWCLYWLMYHFAVRKHDRCTILPYGPTPAPATCRSSKCSLVFSSFVWIC
jgi:hypothetical protein